MEENLPKIRASDPMIAKVKPKKGEVLEITRKSQVAGESLYYRMVIGE